MSDPVTFATIPVYVMSASVWLNIPGVTATTAPGNETQTFESTTANSQGYREYVASPLVDPGTFDFSLQFVPSNTAHQYLMKLAANPTMSYWKTVFTEDGNTEWAFSGSLTSLKPGNGKVGEILTADGSVKLSGAVSGAFA